MMMAASARGRIFVHAKTLPSAINAVAATLIVAAALVATKTDIISVAATMAVAVAAMIAHVREVVKVPIPRTVLLPPNQKSPITVGDQTLLPRRVYLNMFALTASATIARKLATKQATALLDLSDT